MALKSVINWLVLGVVAMALFRVGINMFKGAKEDIKTIKGDKHRKTKTEQ